MNTRPFWRLGGALLCLLLLPVCAFLFTHIDLTPAPRPADTCLGLTVLTDASYAQQPQLSDDLTGLIFHNGQPAAIDRTTRTLYLSLPVEDGTRQNTLPGALSIADGGYTLCFAPDSAFADLKQAVADNHAFTLLAMHAGGGYIPYSVVFTPLPVISIVSGDEPDYSDPYAEHYGSVIVWQPDGGEARTAHADWHRRGMASRLFKKGSWKLSLTNAFGKPKNMDIAGLGSDDDWLLQSMGLEDLNLRQKFISALWNQMTADAEYSLPMCEGEYMELVIDGEYMGLYLLQRRIDAKYLGLEPSQDILLKGSNDSWADSAATGFTITDSPYSDEETFAIAERLFSLTDLSGANAENFVDILCLSAFAGLYDNLRHRNMYYLLTPDKDGYRIYWQLWDNDLSFGYYYDRDIKQTFHEDRLKPRYRREYEAMKALYPDLDQRIAARWRELRQGVLSEENVFGLISALRSEMDESGASARDLARWGRHHGDEDTFEFMYQFIYNQFEMLDALYAADDPAQP